MIYSKNVKIEELNDKKIKEILNDINAEKFTNIDIELDFQGQIVDTISVYNKDFITKNRLKKIKERLESNWMWEREYYLDEFDENGEEIFVYTTFAIDEYVKRIDDKEFEELVENSWEKIAEELYISDMTMHLEHEFEACKTKNDIDVRASQIFESGGVALVKVDGIHHLIYG